MNIMLIETDLSINIEISNELNSFFPDFLGTRVFSAINKKSVKEILEYTTIDVFIANVDLTNESGIEIMLDIRKIEKYELSWLIYYSKSYQKIEVALNTNFIDFYKLPIDYSRLKKSLEKIMSYFPKKKHLLPIVIKYKGEVYSFEQRNIVYIEIICKLLYIVTNTRRVCVGRITLDEIMHMLSDELFRKSNRSTIINLGMVSGVKKDNRTYCVQFKLNKDKIYITEKYKNIVESLFKESHKKQIEGINN